MPFGLSIHKPLLRYPVHLDNSTLPFKGQVPVKRMIASPENQQCTDVGGNLGGNVVDVRPTIQQPQSSALVSPPRIHVKQHGEDFAFRICVYFSIGAPTATSHREHSGATAQVK